MQSESTGKGDFNGGFAGKKGNERLPLGHLDCVLRKPLESVTLGKHQGATAPAEYP